MVKGLYFFTGVIVFGISLVATIFFAEAIGYGDDIGTLLVGISLLMAVVVVCTIIIVYEIKDQTAIILDAVNKGKDDADPSEEESKEEESKEEESKEE